MRLTPGLRSSLVCGIMLWISCPSLQAAIPKAFELKSTAFPDGHPIPERYTVDGSGQSPPLQWTGVPHGTQELVLVMEDMDAPQGPFTHWVIYGLSPRLTGLPPDLPSSAGKLNLPAEQGANSQGRDGYSPPAPPQGSLPHRYQFRLFALDKNIQLEPGLGRHEVLATVQPHILAEADLVGTYKRP